MSADKSGLHGLEEVSQTATFLRDRLRVAHEHTQQLLRGTPRSLTASQRSALEMIGRELERTSATAEQLRERAAGLSAAAPAAPVPPAPQEGFRSAARVLVAEDNGDLLDLLQQLLSERYEVVAVRDGLSALQRLEQEEFQLAVVDVELPGLDGFQLAQRLQHRAGSRAPQGFMYLSGQSSTASKVRGLELGAADYMTKPFDPDELLARLARILATVQREESLRLDALTDSLTGLANYRSFAEAMEREFSRSQRYDQPLSLLTVDLDHLKRINDSAGHQAGNEAIVHVAQVLKEGVRSFELVARQGGDEFGVLLPNTSEAEATRLAERLGKAVARRRVRTQALSVSIGIAARERGSPLTLRELIEKSDAALYKAKRAGGGRISASSAV